MMMIIIMMLMGSNKHNKQPQAQQQQVSQSQPETAIVTSKGVHFQYIMNMLNVYKVIYSKFLSSLALSFFLYQFAFFYGT